MAAVKKLWLNNRKHPGKQDDSGISFRSKLMLWTHAQRRVSNRMTALFLRRVDIGSLDFGGRSIRRVRGPF